MLLEFDSWGQNYKERGNINKFCWCFGWEYIVILEQNLYKCCNLYSGAGLVFFSCSCLMFWPHCRLFVVSDSRLLVVGLLLFWWIDWLTQTYAVSPQRRSFRSIYFPSTSWTQTPCRRNGCQISSQTPSFSSIALVWLEVTWKDSSDPQRRRLFVTERQEWGAAALASVWASATCPTPSVSEHIWWARQKRRRRYGCWLTDGFLHGSLRSRRARRFQSHYRRRSGRRVVF